MKKRLFATLALLSIIFTLLLSLISCGPKYKPVKSTKEELETVMTISYDGKKYKIPYELYRAFFLQLKPSVDKGDGSVWKGADKDKYVNQIDTLICQRICEIYAALYLCEKANINMYSNNIESLIEDYVAIAVEGGEIDGVVYQGFGGNYDAYLASLRKMYLNYSVQTLLFRYQIALQKLASYYMGNITTGNGLGISAQLGQIKYTDESLKSYYLDESKSRHVICALFEEDYYSATRVEQIRDSIASKGSDAEVINYIGGFKGQVQSEVIGKNTYDKYYYSDLTDAVFSLDLGETSEVITLKTDDFEGYAIIYRLPTSDEHFQKAYTDIATAYLYDSFGQIMQNTVNSFMNAISYSDLLNNLDRSTISMK